MSEMDQMDQDNPMISGFLYRLKTAPPWIDNSALPPGSDMYYYCKACQHLADVKPEGWWIKVPKTLCEPCQILVDNDIITRKGEIIVFERSARD